MALDSTKWQVRSDKSIRYIGGAHGAASANYVTVLELHRWLQDLADDASVANDDYMDITTVSPSDKKFDTIITLTNGYTLDDAYTTPASEFIYGGSIIQGTGGTEVIYDGISVVASRGVIVNVLQNNTVLTNKFWNNTPSGESFAGINPDPSNGVAMRFMVKVRDSGANIDNTTLIFTTREWGKTFSEFRIPATGRGVNVVPLQFSDDLNNATVVGTIAGIGDISNLTSGYIGIDLQQGDGVRGYYSQWDRGANSINTFYERMKWLTRNDSAQTLYGLNGQLFRGITHAVDVAANPTPGAWTEGGTALTWGTGATAGTGQLLAYDSANSIAYIQLLTGVVPTNSMTITQGANSATTVASNAVAEKAVSTPFCGASTGSSLVGAFGFALEYADLTTTDKLVALDGVTRNPPNNVTFTVGGIQNGWRILVGPESAGSLNYSQMTLSTPLTGVSTSVVVGSIPANTPSSGTIRIHRADGSYTRHPYSSFSGNTFTITSHDFTSNNSNASNNVFISYIDAASAGTSVSYNTTQTQVQTLFIEARFGGTGPSYTDSIKPARTTATLGTNGGSATISAVSDA